MLVRRWGLTRCRVFNTNRVLRQIETNPAGPTAPTFGGPLSLDSLPFDLAVPQGTNTLILVFHPQR
jgi:hypothetical protein